MGRPYALMLTAGNVSDVKAAPALLERAGRMRYLLADKGYDADRLRRSLRETGAVPVIPGRRNRKRTIRDDKQRYRGRHLIENAFCRLKDFHRVATRYDKLAANFLSGVALGRGAERVPLRQRTSGLYLRRLCGKRGRAEKRCQRRSPPRVSAHNRTSRG
jgi:transposase